MAKRPPKESQPQQPDIQQKLDYAMQFRNAGQLPLAEQMLAQILDAEPDHPEALHLLGVIALGNAEYDLAAEFLAKALAAKPDYAEAHNNLGNVFKGQEKLEDAVACYLRAFAIKPDYAKAHNNLGCTLTDMGRLDDAVASFHKAITIEPDFAEAHYNLGNAFKELGRLEEAVACDRMALAINPDFAEAYYNLGIFQLLIGDFQSGWGNWNWRWRRVSLAADFENHKKYGKPLWRGGAVDGKALLVWAEQGVGESILFASMIPDLIERRADVILECDQRLIPLFSRSFPAMTCVAKDKTLKGKPPDKEFDFHVPFGNLGSWLRPNLPSFSDRRPYLRADAGQRSLTRERYLERGKDFLVGIAWYSKHSTYSEKKSMTLRDLRPLLETPGITFVDLQYGDTGAERNAFTAETGIEVFHDDGVDQMADLDAFASQVAAMDMVVTISNTTAHMAGALGVPTLLMLGTVPIWYWMLEREDSPWYPSLRLFRQHERGNWQGVVERVREELAGRI